jgi:hypothetical protein
MMRRQPSPQYLSQRLTGKYIIYLPGGFSGRTAPLSLQHNRYCGEGWNPLGGAPNEPP